MAASSMSQPVTSSKRAQTHQEALYLGWGAGKGPAQSDRRRVVWCPLLRIHLCNPPARLVAVCLLQLQQDCGWEKRVEEGLRAPSAAAPSSRHQWRWRHQRRQRQRLCKLPWTGYAAAQALAAGCQELGRGAGGSEEAGSWLQLACLAGSESPTRTSSPAGSAGSRAAHKSLASTTRRWRRRSPPPQRRRTPATRAAPAYLALEVDAAHGGVDRRALEVWVGPASSSPLGAPWAA